MNDDTLRVRPSLGIPDRERVLDWLTALLPIFLISVLYYRFQALALEVLSVGGYLMAARLLAQPAGFDVAQLRVTPALVSGLAAAFCLPACAPAWLPALLGGLAAVAEMLPACLRRLNRWHLPRLPIHPVILAYAAVRLVFPASFTGYTMPVQFRELDGLAAATPLASLGTRPLSVELWQLLFGVHAGAIGEGCAVAILLGAVFLVLRRRVRLVAPACMLASVVLLSWLIWGTPLYALLSGGLLLAALLFADRAYAPMTVCDQMVVGVFAGVVTVLVRCFDGCEGVAYGVLLAQLIVPFLPFVYRICRIVWTYCVRWAKVAWRWLRPRILHLACWVTAKISLCAKVFWSVLCRVFIAFFKWLKEVSAKRKNNS